MIYHDITKLHEYNKIKHNIIKQHKTQHKMT